MPHTNSSLLPSSINKYGIELRQLASSEIELVRQWRNHPEVAQYMISQQQITQEQQQQWFEKLQHSDDQQVFVAYYKDNPIGVANCKALNGEPLTTASQIEPGVYMAPDSRYRGTIMAFAPAVALNEALFEYTACNQLIAHVIHSNRGAIRFNQTMGYEQIPTEQKDLVRMQLTEDNFLKAKEKIARLLRF
jgi:UDP-4-amino-4,6-dideoxy-N-acetyl-beta-L-altrosamine N-acetyltransferase